MLARHRLSFCLAGAGDCDPCVAGEEGNGGAVGGDTCVAGEGNGGAVGGDDFVSTSNDFVSTSLGCC